ncbi:MAG TPA: radical SAM family heme chaperone HemW [Candidatus Dormibacteraeota bacterium]
MTAEPAGSLYLHLPFCAARCPYCDFAIHVGGQELHRPYVDAVIRELDQLALAEPGRGGLETVYLGGGTPGLIAPFLLARLLQAVEDRFGIHPGAEVTLEANPAGLTVGRARSWRGLGVNRVSLGVQSLDDPTLRWLGRNHDRRQALAGLAALERAGFTNVSCDLIYAVPAQPTPVFLAGLRDLLRFEPAHVSCYELTVEPGTPLARSVAQGRVPGPREADFLEQHAGARELLEGAGLAQYEVSNYARPGRESRHNLGYWRGRHYLAAGSGAHGFLAPLAASMLGLEVRAGDVGVRYWNLRSAPTYIRQVLAQGHGRRGAEGIDPEQRELERLACGLRLREGLELDRPGQLRRAAGLAELGLVTLRGRRVTSTDRGIEVLDRLTLELAMAGAVPALA